MRYRQYIERKLSEGLPDHLIDEFLEWYESQRVEFINIVWNDSLNNDTYAHAKDSCHYNSFYNSMKHGYEIYSGVVVQEYKSKNINPSYFHSYNVKASKVFDFTYYNNYKPLMEAGMTLPPSYAGVLIPRRLITKIKEVLEIPEPGRVKGCDIKFNRMLVVTFLHSRSPSNLIEFIHKYME